MLGRARRILGGSKIGPTLDLNFASGTMPPGLTFRRASGATRINSAGVLELVGSNVPRIDYDPVTLACKGLLMEPAATNLVPNSSGSGAVVGGTLPTGWSVANSGGLTVSVVGIGTEGGIAYVDLRASGTTTNAQGCNIDVVAANFPVLASTQYAFSSYVKLVSGSLAGMTVNAYADKITAAGSSGGNITGSNFLPDASPLVSQRRTLVGTTGADTAKCNFRAFWARIPSGVTVDFTLRVAAPQVEAGSIATSYIPTAGASATRAAEVCSAPFGKSQGTFLLECTNYSAVGGADRVICTTTQEYASYRFNRMGSWNNASELNSPLVVLPNSPHNYAIAWGSAERTVVENGSSAYTSNTGFTAEPTVWFGTGNGNSPMNGHIRRIRYYPAALPATTLQALTR